MDTESRVQGPVGGKRDRDRETERQRERERVRTSQEVATDSSMGVLGEACQSVGLAGGSHKSGRKGSSLQSSRDPQTEGAGRPHPAGFSPSVQSLSCR